MPVSDLGNPRTAPIINGKRISSGQAQAGDVLRFGSAEFKLMAGASNGGGAGCPQSGVDVVGISIPPGRALQFELKPPAPNGRAAGPTTWTIGRDRNRAQFVIDEIASPARTRRSPTMRGRD